MLVFFRLEFTLCVYPAPIGFLALFTPCCKQPPQAWGLSVARRAGELLLYAAYTAYPWLVFTHSGG